jgi:hypothetical protein
VKRRICETCQYFEATGLKNSGWCRHPKRQFGSGVRLVVRASEIACRNGWNSDLWTPAGIEPENEEHLVGSNGFVEGSDELTSILPARIEPPVDRSPAGAQQDDIVVDHSPYQGQQPVKDARDLVVDPRAAILRAREQYRSRKMGEGRIVDRLIETPPPLAGPSERQGSRDPEANIPRAQDDLPENAPFLADGAGSAAAPVTYTVPPVRRDEIQRRPEMMTEFPEDTARFESIPELPETIARPQQSEHLQVEAQHGFDGDRPDEFAFLDAHSSEDIVLESPSPTRRGLVDRIFGSRRPAARPSQEPSNAWDEDEFDDWAEGRVSRTAKSRSEWEFEVETPRPMQEREARPQTDRTFDTSEFVPVETATLAWSDDDDELGYDALAWPELPAIRESYPAERSDDQRARSRPSREQPARVPALSASSGHAGPQRRGDRGPSSIGDTGEHIQDDSPSLANNRWLEEDLLLDPVPHTRSRVRGTPLPDRWSPRSYDDGAEDDRRWDAPHTLRDDEFDTPAQGTASSQRVFAPEVPRICRTCRDFRISEAGDRGWCTNQWAFQHRRMVDADFLSCRSTTGTWWLAHDRYWQQDTDITRHAQETPLVDRLIERGLLHDPAPERKLIRRRS